MPLLRPLSSLLALTAACFALSVTAYAAAPPPDILKTDLMVVVAHPDDEGMVASVMARYDLGEGKTTACVYMTRGEGGGNSVGTQLGPALGELREAELRECLTRVGVRHIYFLDKTDWAYTESAAATLAHWGHDDTLGRLVRLVRNLRPEVMATFLPAPTGGQHGHHQTAGLLTTEAFEAAADPAMFPEQIKQEGLRPWQVKKLYYVHKQPGSLEIDTNGKAPDGRSFAEIAAEAESHHRSQWGGGGFAGFRGPARPSYLTLVKSALPADAPENGLFAGLDAGRGLRLTLEPETYGFGPGQEGSLKLVLMNATSDPMTGLRAAPDFPPGWKLVKVDPEPPAALAPKERIVIHATVRAPDDLKPGEGVSMAARVTAHTASGAVDSVARAAVIGVPGVEAEIVPLPAIRMYRDWTRGNDVERFAGVLPSWVPFAAGQPGPVRVALTNHGGQAQSLIVRLEAPQGWSVEPKTQDVSLAAGGLGGEATFTVTPPANAPVADVPLTATVTDSGGSAIARADGVAQVTPYLEASRLAAAPAFDGGLAGWPDAPQIDIPHTSVVQGNVKDDADSSAKARVAYDDRFLYVEVSVKDDVVVSNIAPDDIKAHWRSDSVEICVDPKPRSESTLTTFKLGIFPWDTAGHVNAARDADLNPGPVAETAPGCRLASKRTADGYLIEAALPWSSIGVTPGPGLRLGFNVIIYDGDQKDARVGDDINKSRIAWSFRPGIWGRPEQWGELTLK